MNLVRSRILTAATIGALVLGTPLLTSCGGVAEQAVQNAAEVAAEQAGAGDVEINEDGMTVTDEDGNNMAIGDNIALPDNWPSEVPAFDGGTLQTVMVEADGASVNAMWIADGSAADVAAAYGQALEAAGYTADSNLDSVGMAGGEYSGDVFGISVGAIEADGQTSLIVTATKN